MTATPPLAELLGLGDLTAAELQRLATQHRVGDVLDLERVCRTNRLRDDAGFGPERQAAIRKALRSSPIPRPGLPLAEARDLASRLLSSLQNHESAVRLAAVGGIRRMDPHVDEVELLASAHEPDELLAKFERIGPVEEVLSRAGNRVTIRTEDGAQASLTVHPEDPAPYLADFVARTGPDAHMALLRERATARSMTFEARGLCDANGPLPLAWEPDIYTALELPIIPAELRHRADAETPPSDLVSMRDVKGLGHVHTDAAAGTVPLNGFARAAMQNGFDWLLVADRGATQESVAALRDAAVGVHADAELPVHVIVGVEARVLADASLDVADDALADADFVIAAVEDLPGEAPSEGDPTARYLAAIRHPRVNALAHPRTFAGMGPAQAPDWAQLIPAMREANTALEVGGESARLPLDGVLDAAGEAGVRFLASAEAHDFRGIDREIVAVGALRRGARRVSEVLSTLSAAELLRWASR